MRFGRSRVVIFVAAVLACGCSGANSRSPTSISSHSKKIFPSLVLPSTRWTEEKRALHALNRLAYGPAPGDVERVAREGVAAWIRAQMVPESLPDQAVEAKVGSLPTLRMSIAALQAEYPRPRPVGAKDDPNLKDKLRELVLDERRPAVMQRELVTAKLVRAVESSRQLQEVLTDFWFNHFNVFLGKGEDRWMIGPYERDAIRPYVFGNFRQLLEATARHPAMLFYLDNWLSTREGERGGINENYARELLELHTLGVDGGYTQEDVREVARCFTGWSIVQPRGRIMTSAAKGRADQREAGTFAFRDLAHDKGAKLVLGEIIPAGGGIEDGEKVLDLLASRPATARLVAMKLCRKFVADVPPSALVERVATTFQRTRGDLPSVYAAIFSSREFWSDSAFASKTKSPLELAVSAVRAIGGTVREDAPQALAQQIARMGEPLYQCQPPTGYKDTADAWVNTGALLNRLNFAVALAAGRIPNVEADPALMALGASDPVRAAALALGSPEFQKR